MNRSLNYRKKKNRKRNIAKRNPEYLERRHQKKHQDRENYRRSDSYKEKKRQKKNKRVKIRSNEYQDRHNEHQYQIRTDPKIRDLENQKIKIYKKNYSRMVNNYENSIREGPIHLCYSCEGLFFAKSISSYRKNELSKFIEDDTISQIIRYHNDSIQLCVTCLDSIKRGAIPKLCVVNGLEFPPIPEELADLTELEERLISPRLPFMQIRELGIDKQYGIKGNVVNIPISVDKTVKLLPRSFDKTATIQILLKRMRQHKSTYIREYIRLFKVKSAAEYLVHQPLYIEEGINLSDEWNTIQINEIKEFIIDHNDNESQDDLQQQVDVWDETINDLNLNPSNNQTLIQEGLVFAPGEGVKPESILYDQLAEELSFPTIFCGQKRYFPISLSITDISKSYLRRIDRRAACKIPYIFYIERKKQMKALKEAIGICMRKKPNENQLKAKEVLNSEIINNLLSKDQAYRVLVNDRTSPVYWQRKMKELFAMIRQLGCPTFFLTLSAAETRWTELLVILYKVLKNEDITEEQVSTLSFPEKCELIRSDPVTCTRYFDHRINELFKLLKSENGPFAPYKIVETYYRIEFQSRGSAHVHSLIWLEGAPKYDQENIDSKRACEEFIDKFTTCTAADQSLRHLINLQYHKHSKTCKRTKEDVNICRFGIPVYPMPRTMILTPLKLDDIDDEDIEIFETNIDIIENKMKEIDHSLRDRNDTNDLDFGDFLNKLNLTEEEYLVAIRFTLDRPKIFLQRKPTEMRINSYNNNILSLHRANMDLQFILDPYSCVQYVLNYINKSNRGMSALLRSIVEDSKAGYVSHQQKLKEICSVFLNCSEMSAQEAVYILLSMTLSKSSRQVIFINTGERDQRTKLLKSEKELQEMDPDSNDIMVSGLLDLYIARPDDLENLCLAEFASNYNYSKTKKNLKKNDFEECNEDNLEESRSNSSSIFYKLKYEKGWISKRKTPKVIRYRKYQFERDPTNFYREKCMLYLHYRDEDTELIHVDCQKKFFEFRYQIEEIERHYVNNPNTNYDELEHEIEDIIRIECGEPEDIETDDQFAVYDLKRYESNLEEEIEDKKFDKKERKSGDFCRAVMLKDDTFLQLIKCLNSKQRNYLMELIYTVRTTQEPFYHFISGGAGTGKSVLISAIYQTLNRHFNFHFPDPEKVKILLLAPTGMAAFHIGGTTIHQALGIPVSQNSSLPLLNADTKSKLRNIFWNLKLIIIDEISMVGAQTLRKIDNQLKQIFENEKPFGGISMLTFGDFNQLRPVKESYIFENTSNSDISILSGPILWRLFKYYKLTEIMRQKDDLSFATALNHLATGQLSEEDKILFSKRLFNKNDPQVPEEAIRLFYTNEQVEKYNMLAIRRSPLEENIVEALDFVTSGTTKLMRDRALFSVANRSIRDTYGLPKSLILKVGIKYMVTNNIDISDGLVNGTTGILRDITLCQDRIEILWLDFGIETIGFSARSHYQQNNIGLNFLTPIRKIIKEINTRTNSQLIKVSRKQFPLVPAEAITIHKSQGQTYDEVVIDMGRKLDLSVCYTAFSRAKTTKGLFLLGKEIKFPKERPIDHPINTEMDRLEKFSNLEFNLEFLIEKEKVEDAIIVVYQNVPYLAKYSEALVADQNIASADVLVLVETRTNDLNIDGFELFSQLVTGNIRPFGISIYVKCEVLPFCLALEKNFILHNSDAHIEYLCFMVNQIIFIVLYSSPKFPNSETVTIITELVFKYKKIGSKILICADLNVKRDSMTGQKMLQYISSLDLKCCIESMVATNIYGNQIDYIFSSKNISIHSWVYQTIISDHYPIFFICK